MIFDWDYFVESAQAAFLGLLLGYVFWRLLRGGKAPHRYE